MLNKKQMLVLALASAVTIPMYSVKSEKIDFDTFESNFKNKVGALKEFAANVKNMVQQGNYNGIASLLAVNLTPAVNYLKENTGIIQARIEEGLDFLKKQVPGEYDKEAKKAYDMAVAKLASLGKLAKSFNGIEKYSDLSQYKNEIASALEAAANSAQAKQIKDILIQAGADLKAQIEVLETINPEIVKAGIEKTEDLAIKLKKGTDVSLFDVTDIVVPGFVELQQKFAPTIVDIGNIISGAFLDIASIVKETTSKYQLPKGAKTALENIQKHSKMLIDNEESIKEQANILLDKVSAALNS